MPIIALSRNATVIYEYMLKGIYNMSLYEEIKNYIPINEQEEHDKEVYTIH